MTVTRDKILIIEDERNQIELIKYNLEVNGYEVVVSEDGEDGFLKCLEVKPDLVLIDWMLPKLSGIEVCHKIRKNNEIKEIPIIMVTARSEDGNIMAIQHNSLSITGIQFHPESIATEFGKTILKNFLDLK